MSSFRLDKYEVTIGRFRQFYSVYSPTMIPAGAGKNPNNPADTGWDLAWNSKLLPKANMDNVVNAVAGWNDSAQASDRHPMGRMDWYMAAAFCIWDGGRLPTEAEWNYAAAGGSEQRFYPWSIPPASQILDATYAAHGQPQVENVGSRSPKGDARWGHADLAGNVHEWVQDWYVHPYSQVSCTDCANLIEGPSTHRSCRGGAFDGMPEPLATLLRGSCYPLHHYSHSGARCARAH